MAHRTVYAYFYLRCTCITEESTHSRKGGRRPESSAPDFVQSRRSPTIEKNKPPRQRQSTRAGGAVPGNAYAPGKIMFMFHCYSSVPLATGRFQPADAWFNPFSRKTSIGKTSTLEKSGLFDTASSYVIMMSRSKPDMHAEALIKLSISRPDDCSFNCRQT